MPECFERGEDAGDLVGALFRLPAEAGGEAFGELSRAAFGILADGGEELAEDGDLSG